MESTKKVKNYNQYPSLPSIKRKLSAKRRKLRDIDELIAVLTEKTATNDTLLNRTDLSLAKAERIKISSDILLLEHEESELEKIYKKARASFEEEQPQPY